MIKNIFIMMWIHQFFWIVPSLQKGMIQNKKVYNNESGTIFMSERWKTEEIREGKYNVNIEE